MANEKKLPPKYQEWVDARNRYHLSHAHIQMAREIGFNPEKLGKLANHKQEPWKLPLPEYIEELYVKQFKKRSPENVITIEQLVKIKAQKKAEKKGIKETMRAGYPPGCFPVERESDMIKLRPITDEDFIQVDSWPPYPVEFAYMDYALKRGGWLDEYRDREDTWIYIAEFNNQAVGFSLLSLTSKGDAEFRIAVHPDHTGMGFGPQITMKTLQAGFCELGMELIHLIVRKNHFPAMKVYNRLKFKKVGESVHAIQGKPVEFYDMEIARECFDNFQGKESE